MLKFNQYWQHSGNDIYVTKDKLTEKKKKQSHDIILIKNKSLDILS